MRFWKCSIAAYDILLRATDRVLLPRYKGSKFDGTLDSAFYTVVCRHKQKQCPCDPKCPYAVVFQPVYTHEKNQGESEYLRRFRDAPRAYVIEPSLDHKDFFQPGEFLSFRLLLFGNIIRYFPWFIVALQALDRFDMSMDRFNTSNGRGGMELLEIHSVHPLNGTRKPIYLYDHEAGLLPNESLLVSSEEIIQKSREFSSDEIILEFLTPTRIRYQDSWLNSLTFTQLMTTILRRAELLSKFYGQGTPDDRWDDLLVGTEEIILKSDQLFWYDWIRHSQLRGMMKLGGIVGTITYEGKVLSNFMPYLLLGQLLHIGKGYVFGMGKYIVRNGKGEVIWNEQAMT